VCGQTDTGLSIREIILGMWPGRFAPTALRDDVSLGEDGLGLDSVEVVELIFACEDRWGRRVSEQLFTSPALTIERLSQEFSGR
jgi:acyl carrier protein